MTFFYQALIDNPSIDNARDALDGGVMTFLEKSSSMVFP